MRPADAYAQQQQNIGASLLGGLNGCNAPKSTTLTTLSSDFQSVVLSIENLVGELGNRIGASRRADSVKGSPAMPASPSLLNDYENLLYRLRDVGAQLSDINNAV